MIMNSIRIEKFENYSQLGGVKFEICSDNVINWLLADYTLFVVFVVFNLDSLEDL